MAAQSTWSILQLLKCNLFAQHWLVSCRCGTAGSAWGQGWFSPNPPWFPLKHWVVLPAWWWWVALMLLGSSIHGDIPRLKDSEVMLQGGHLDDSRCVPRSIGWVFPKVADGSQYHITVFLRWLLICHGLISWWSVDWEFLSPTSWPKQSQSMIVLINLLLINLILRGILSPSSPNNQPICQSMIALIDYCLIQIKENSFLPPLVTINQDNVNQ